MEEGVATYVLSPDLALIPDTQFPEKAVVPVTQLPLSTEAGASGNAFVTCIKLAND